MENHAIELHGLTKRFRAPDGGWTVAVDNIDMGIGSGEVVAFLGPNGAGKTTTLDMVLGLSHPTSGAVSVFGNSPRRAIEGGRVSALLQTGGLLRDLSVRETVQYIRSQYAHNPKPAQPVEEVMALAGITEIAGRKVSKCSGGEQQRLKFALALLPDPDLLILDEPTAGMDVMARRHFWQTMRETTSAGRTVVFATHYLEEADDFSDRVVMMDRGRLVADGPTADLRSRSHVKAIAATVADPAYARSLLERRTHILDVELSETRIRLKTADSDLVARVLLNDLDARDLQIAAPKLEDAFLALTGNKHQKNEHKKNEHKELVS